MLKFTHQRQAAATGDMTDKTWTAEAIDSRRDVVVADYTYGPWSDDARGRWLAYRGTGLPEEDNIVGLYDTIEDAVNAVEYHALGTYHGARDAERGAAIGGPDDLAAMGGEFAGAYRAAYEAWVADDEAASAERRAGA